MPFLKIFLTWLLFLPVPVINGFFREKWYRQIVGDLIAHQIGTVVVSSFFLVYAYVFFGKIGMAFSARQLFAIGLIWLSLTLAFEFGIGLAAGRSWPYMLADYKIWQGRIWPLLLAVVFFSPFIIKFLFKK